VEIEAINLGCFGRSDKDFAFSDDGRAIEPLIVRPHELSLLLLELKASHVRSLTFARVFIHPGEFAFDNIDRDDRTGRSRADEHTAGIGRCNTSASSSRIERDTLFELEELLLPLDLTVRRIERNQVKRAANLGHHVKRIVDGERCAEEERASEL